MITIVDLSGGGWSPNKSATHAATKISTISVLIVASFDDN
jgi:hypothetical protein